MINFPLCFSFILLGLFSLPTFALTLTCPNTNLIDKKNLFECSTANMCNGQNSFQEARIISFSLQNATALKYVCIYNGPAGANLVARGNYTIPANRSTQLLGKWEWSDVFNGFTCYSNSPSDCPIPAVANNQQPKS